MTEGVGAGSPSGARPVLELSRVPDLVPLYARGVAGSVAAVAGRRRTVRLGDLPDARLRVAGVQADPRSLTDYQHLVGETASDDLPAGYVHVLAFPVAMALMVRHDFPLPLLGVVHVANHVEQRRPVRLGEAMDVVVGAQDLRAHRAGVTVDVVSEVFVDGDLVWRGVSTYLAKGMRLASPTPTYDLSVAERTGGPGATDTSGTVDDVSVAERDGVRGATDTSGTPTGRWRLDADTGRRYAAVSGDRNPIHTSAVAAKAFGFPRAIAHGMYTAARALADVGPARGGSFTWDVEFAKPVLLPSTVDVRVDARVGGHTVTAWHPRSGRTHLTCRVSPLG